MVVTNGPLAGVHGNCPGSRTRLATVIMISPCSMAVAATVRPGMRSAEGHRDTAAPQAEVALRRYVGKLCSSSAETTCPLSIRNLRHPRPGRTAITVVTTMAVKTTDAATGTSRVPWVLLVNIDHNSDTRSAFPWFESYQAASASL
jgi:hypothetical protein